MGILSKRAQNQFVEELNYSYLSTSPILYSLRIQYLLTKSSPDVDLYANANATTTKIMLVTKIYPYPTKIIRMELPTHSMMKTPQKRTMIPWLHLMKTATLISEGMKRKKSTRRPTILNTKHKQKKTVKSRSSTLNRHTARFIPPSSQ